MAINECQCAELLNIVDKANLQAGDISNGEKMRHKKHITS